MSDDDDYEPRDENGEPTDVYFVDIPTSFFAYYCSDNPFYRVVSVNEHHVTIMFRGKAITDAFEQTYRNYGYYRITTEIRQSNRKVIEWSNTYVAYRYGMDLFE